MLGRETLVVLTTLSQLIAAKMDDPILHMQGWVNGGITIEVARVYSQIIHGDRLPSPLQDRDPDWDPT